MTLNYTKSAKHVLKKVSIITNLIMAMTMMMAIMSMIIFPGSPRITYILPHLHNTGSVFQTPTSPYLILGTWWVVGGWECIYLFPMVRAQYLECRA